jgi:hypothetical protein
MEDYSASGGMRIRIAHDWRDFSCDTEITAGMCGADEPEDLLGSGALGANLISLLFVLPIRNLDL